MKMFDDRQSKVCAKAVEVAIKMFEDILNSDAEYSLYPADYKVFENYMVPQFNKLMRAKKDDELVFITCTRYLPLLAKIGQKFTEIAVASRLAKHQQQLQDLNSPTQSLGSDSLNEENDLISMVSVGVNQTIVSNQKELGGEKNRPEEEKRRLDFSHVNIYTNFDQEVESIRSKFA